MLERSTKRLVITSLLAAAMVLAGTVAYLARDLPNDVDIDLSFPAAGFQFVFGYGHPVAERMMVDGYADGQALLSSGPVEIEAERNKVLRYTWSPTSVNQEAVFYWRQQGVNDNVVRIELSNTGTRYLDLFAHPQWRGQITEFGFLLIDQNQPGQDKDGVEIGPAVFVADRLPLRLQLLWQGWSTFERWSQHSINFLRGGAASQVISLPLLVISWLSLSLILFGLASRRGSKQSPRHTLKFIALIFLLAWMLLDIRWTSNNIRHIRLALPPLWQGDAQQRLANNLDGEIYQFVERLKNDVLGAKTSRILIIGNQVVPDYYLQRAKYHLLPHSVNATRSFDPRLVPESLDFVIFFGQPGGVNETQGWHPGWQQALKRLDTDPLATTYKVRKS